MNKLSLSLLTVIFAAALVGCGKKKECCSKAHQPTETTERVSGTHAAVDIAWESEDLK